LTRVDKRQARSRQARQRFSREKENESLERDARLFAAAPSRNQITYEALYRSVGAANLGGTKSPCEALYRSVCTISRGKRNRRTEIVGISVQPKSPERCAKQEQETPLTSNNTTSCRKSRLWKLLNKPIRTSNNAISRTRPRKLLNKPI
jgi:hypothetical protein